MYENHTDRNLKPVACHYCNKTFDTKKAVMKHQKNAHKEKARQCTYFNGGKCNYRQYLCWFNHNELCRKLYANIVIRLLSCEQISCSLGKNIMVSFFQTVLTSLMAIVTIHLVDLNKHKKESSKDQNKKMYM